MIEYYICRSEEDDRLKIECVNNKLIFNFNIGESDQFELHFNKNDLERMINQLTIMNESLK